MLANFIQIINFLSGISDKIYTHIGIIICFAISVLVMYIIFVVRHYPRHKLSAQQIADIKKYGLMHFTDSENVASILEKGLIPDGKKAVLKAERDMVWTYIANPNKYNKRVREIHRKGKRKSYDSVVYLKNISDDDILKMRCRIFTEVVVYPGTYKTSDMVAKEI